MLDKDFDWCFNHENLFRDWLYFRYDCIHSNELDPATIFDLWQDAKKYALEIANSKDPVLFYWTKMDYWIAESRRHIFWLSDSCQQASLLLKFLNSMLASSKNKKLELFADIGDNVFIDYVIKWKKDPNSKFELDTKPFYGMIHPLLMPGQIESDYDYALPDGGIKETETDETETITKADETKTITKTETDETETITKTITEEDETITKTKTEEESVDVILPKHNSLNNEDLISAMQKAIKKGLIEIIEKGKYKWKGFEDVKSNFNAALAYFIAKALKIKMELKPDKTPTEDSYVDINKKFPENYDIKEVFDLDIQSDQLVNALRAKNIQKWREAIDDFFDEET